MDAKQFMQGSKDVDNRLDWQKAEIRKVPESAIKELTDEYNQLGLANNPNLRGEFIINEFSIRSGNGGKFYKPERKVVVYGH